MTNVARWISGRHSDAGGPGASVIATVHAPAPAPMPPGDLSARVSCAFLFDNDKYIFGVDEAQCIELAIGLVCHLFVHRGVCEIVVSLKPSDETGSR
jgi:hypothetical protein